MSSKPNYIVTLHHGDQKVSERYADSAERAKNHAVHMLKNYLEFEKPVPLLDMVAIVQHYETRETVWRSDGLPT